MEWTKEETDELVKYFKTGISELTLFQRLHKKNKFRTYEAIMRQIRRMRDEGYERDKEKAMKSLRIGYLDIEATNLNASFGIMLSWFIKEKGKNHYDSAVITKKELFDYKFDKRLVEELLEALKKYDIVYTHYGSDYRYDVPFIRTRAFKHHLESKLPKRMEMFIMDTYPILKCKLKLYSNRLGVAAELFGVKELKTPVSPTEWQLAAYGNPDALAYVVDHNKKDVHILEQVHKRLETIESKIYRSI